MSGDISLDLLKIFLNENRPENAVKWTCFTKYEKCHVSRGTAGYESMSPNVMWEWDGRGGLKSAKKSVMFYENGP